MTGSESPTAQEHVLGLDDGNPRLVKGISDLSKAFALAVPHEQALAIQNDVSFFQAVESVLTTSAGGDRRGPEEIDHVIQQIVSRVVSSDEVIGILAAAGLKKPEISILSAADGMPSALRGHTAGGCGRLFDATAGASRTQPQPPVVSR